MCSNHCFSTATVVTRRHLNVTVIRTLAVVLFFNKSFLTYYKGPWNLLSWRAWSVADSVKASKDAKTTRKFWEIIFIFFFKFMWPCIVTNFRLIKPIYSFQARPGSTWKLLSNLHDIYRCRMYSGKLPMMGRGTALNM